MTASLASAAWIGDPAATRLMTALEAAGGEAAFVGGCVRDTLLGLAGPELDIDVATSLLPEAIVATATAAGMKPVPTGIEHGTVTVIAGERRFEVTTFRRDVATDGRHAVVAFGGSLAEDAARRDFTINALYCDRHGRLIDPLGGLADLAARRVRFVGDPDRRIVEDYLRILRFFRFHARFATGPSDPAGLAACARHVAGLARLSGERVAQELRKLLVAPGAIGTAAELAAIGVPDAIGLPACHAERLARLLALDPAADWLLRLGALLREPQPRPGLGRAVAARLRLSAEERDRLETMLGRELPPLAEAGAALRRRWYREGVASWRDRQLLQAALAGFPAAGLVDRLAAAEAWRRPALPVAGADLLALGIAPGPAVGQLLRQVEAWWLERDMRPEREAVLAELRRLLP